VNQNRDRNLVFQIKSQPSLSSVVYRLIYQLQ